MFEELATFPRIVVSGPHRSGTTICGEMIAADLDYKTIREEGFGWSNVPHFASCLQREGVVLQAPFMAHRLHFLQEIVDPETVCVVFMLRALADVEASQARVEAQLLAEDGGGGGVARYRLRALHTNQPTAAAIYENWQAQKPLIRHWREVEYESLRAHRLWSDAHGSFVHRQTRP